MGAYEFTDTVNYLIPFLRGYLKYYTPRPCCVFFTNKRTHVGHSHLSITIFQEINLSSDFIIKCAGPILHFSHCTSQSVIQVCRFVGEEHKGGRGTNYQHQSKKANGVV
jgi:hypothetical protein